MILALEIILTVVAWRKGWKSKALIPVVIILGGTILFGLLAGASGLNSNDIFFPSLVFDFVLIGILSTMCAYVPEKIKTMERGIEHKIEHMEAK